MRQSRRRSTPADLQEKSTKKARGTPNSNSEISEKYSSQEFWDERYKDEDVRHIWYFDYERLKPLLRKFVQPGADVLEIGCGDAPVLDGMAADGYNGNLLALDFSGKVIDDLSKKSGDARGVKYVQMDARDLQIGDASFDVVMDKGTIDAMLCDDEERWDNVYKIMSEACRVLKSDGRIILISHMAVGSSELDEALQNAILPALQEKSSVQWQVVAHVSEKESEDSDDHDENDEEDDDGSASASGPAVYVITSTPRRFTRSMLTSSADLEIPMKVKYYGS
jgi:ubiquinone/menaquinone biosynthesis C-methylase UbiE